MKKKMIFVVLSILVFVYVGVNWYAVDSFFYCKRVATRISDGLSVSEYERLRLAEYQHHLAEIRIRGCSIGAKLLFFECSCPTLLQKKSLGDLYVYFEEALQKNLK